MSTQVKIKEDPDSLPFECNSELMLEKDIVKIEVDTSYVYEENVESLEVKPKVENIRSGMSINILFIKVYFF